MTIGRRFLALGSAAALAVPRAAAAQQQGRMVRIGWLSSTPLSNDYARDYWEAFRLELQRFGWTEGRSVAFERRFAEGIEERFPVLARELVDLGVDLIVASSGYAAEAARDATATIPVVFIYAPDPVGRKLVASLARPGGNLTGLSSMSFALIDKRLEVLRDAFPAARRIGYLPGGVARLDEPAGRAAAALGLTWLPARVERPDDLADAIAALSDVDAWFVGESALYFARSDEVLSLLAAQRKPAMYPNSVFVHAGGLLSYGVDFNSQSRRAAWFVDRILRGAKPAEIPVEQPTRLELVVNLKTARALGLTLPTPLLARADEVIE